MSKKLLIISPYFPPCNAADMQRIRMSLPYFKELGWEAEVIMVHESYVDMIKDPLLLTSVPQDIPIHKVNALAKKWTSKFGLGSIALRALWYFHKKGNQLLKHKNFDLIYFSTTQFPVCILGAYWKKKFGIPYVIDIQDPWHTDYYKGKPRAERPKKYWFSYQLNKFLEPIAMRSADGLISVSTDYIQILQDRYPQLKSKPTAVITFGAFDNDFKIAKENDLKLPLSFDNVDKYINLIYIGRGGHDMKPALVTLFSAFKKGLENNPKVFNKFRMHFIGTSYAPYGKGKPTVSPIANLFDLNDYVTEYTNRIGFYQSLKNLQKADGLIVIGSDETAYNASKLYPYVLAKKPLLAILNSDSKAANFLNECNAGFLLGINVSVDTAYNQICTYLESIQNNIVPSTNWDAFKPYTATYMAEKQVELFKRVCEL